MLLSCGVALQHFTVALSALGWATDVHRFPNPRDSNHVAGIDIIGRSASDADIALAAAIPHRRTDRYWVSSWPVPGADVATLAQQTARGCDAATGGRQERMFIVARIRQSCP